jgi:hypothetical protein
MAFAVPWVPMDATERRLNQRFPIHIPLRYKLVAGRLVKTGQGRTLNLSSSGLLIECDTVLPRGVRVELSLAWPATIDGAVGLTLVVIGTTLRTTGNSIAVAHSRHYFRTRSLRAAGSLRVCAFSAMG